LSATAIAHLVTKTSASAVLASPALNKSASEALALLNPTGDKPLALYMSKPYDAFIGGEPVNSVTNLWDPDPNHYIDEWDRNVIVLHSSGTTGLPKAMYTSHEYWLGYATCHDFRNVEEASGLSTTTLPLYHVSYVQLLNTNSINPANDRDLVFIALPSR
jgi:acyl-CoA synthetase (AMP-forming)/AMP-acid ligase II